MKEIRFLVFFLGTLSPLFGETLLRGAVYFDSRDTLVDVIVFAAAKDNANIEKIINEGHVSRPTAFDREVVVTLTGNEANSPAEFYFVNGPMMTYWTLAKFLYSKTPGAFIKAENLTDLLSKDKEALIMPTSSPTPVAVQPVPSVSPSPSPKPEISAEEEEGRVPAPKQAPAGLDTEGGRRIWHKDANGKWKYYLRDGRKHPLHATPIASPTP